MNKKPSLAFSRLLVITWTVIIVFLTLLPGSTVKLFNFWGLMTFDKIGHAFLYAIYSALLVLSFHKISEKSYFTKQAILKSLVISVGVGSSLEILQNQIPERNFDFVDMFANIGGSIIGIVFLKIFSKIQEVS